MPLMLDLIAYLTAECCAGDPGQCLDVGTGSSRPKRVASPVSSKARKPAKP
jgi:hypothetical protein